MGYFYAIERAKFEAEFKEFSVKTRGAGISEEAIQAMYEFDKVQFNRDRAFYRHTQSLESTYFSDGDTYGDDRSTLLKDFSERLSRQQPEISSWNRYSWIEDIDNPELAKQVKTLCDEDLEMITCLIVDGLSLADLSRKLQVSRTTITKRFARIKKHLTAFVPDGSK